MAHARCSPTAAVAMSVAARPPSRQPDSGVLIAFVAWVAIMVAAFAFEARVRGKSWADSLRSWWVDPAVATFGFALAVAIYDSQELRAGHTTRDGITNKALVMYWVGIGIWVNIIPPPQGIPDGLPFESVYDVAYLLMEVVSGVAMYDFVFFFIHLAMHKFAKGPHKVHHSPGDLRAKDVLTHSLVDGALQVLTNVMVQRRAPWGTPKSRLARAVHNLVVTWMLTESHTCAASPCLARRWFRGVQRHRAHHMHHAPYYQQFFGYLDDFHSKCMLSVRGV
mmetsp:Transcript_74589/g.210736  ORF Transcript_74589/g.210736 Transcript_74589/m.210736 type:complete len:279 (-) Transcript_74589:408-1244(-)